MKVHHVGYLVKNIEKSICAFEELGYSAFAPVFFDEIRKADFIFMKNEEGFCVELISPNADSSIFPLLKQYKNTPYHICYECDNLEKEIEKLSTKKYLPFLEPAPAPAIHENARVAFLINANAGIIELLEV